MKWNAILPWLIPLLVTILIGGAQLYEVVGKVNAIEVSRNTEGKKALKQLNDLRWRVTNIEKHCCEEVP